ncbi:hypothetical protein [Nocardiopsis deserti]|uniref:hypothetical protein n=1 Tax=Nocardiopsis deserti TaxID=2605988 RepID=UPI0012391D1E|nr:hypothetical protein [Nocardiopsis deserti]
MSTHGLPRFLAGVSPEVAESLSTTPGVGRVTPRQILCSAVGLLNLRRTGGTVFFVRGGAVLTRPGMRMVTLSGLQAGGLPRRYL